MKNKKDIFSNEKIRKLYNVNEITKLTTKNVAEHKHGKNFLYTPTLDIKEAQQEIATFLSCVATNNASVAYKKDYCYFDFLEPHKENYHFLRLDIVSFFYSIPLSEIKKCLRFFDEDGNKEDDVLSELLSVVTSKKNETRLDDIIELVTYEIPKKSSNTKFAGKRVLPIGFVTSPVISNIVFRKIDILIQKFCISKGIVYTRYADDLLFSCPKTRKKCFIHSDSFIYEIAVYLNIMNFQINKRKTIKADHTISLNGYIIQQKTHYSNGRMSEIRLSNKKTNIIKKTLHCIEQNKNSDLILKKIFHFDTSKLMKFPTRKKELYIQNYSNKQLANKLCGYRSFILSIIIYHNKKNILTEDTLKKYVGLVKKIEQAIKKF